MTTTGCSSPHIVLALLGAVLAGCPEDEDCNETGCSSGLVCAGVCEDWSGGCGHFECVECASDDDCGSREICRDNSCRASFLDVQCSDLCATAECATPEQCSANGMVCTDLVNDPWGHCMTPCTTNADCPGGDDRDHWVRCLQCPDQPSFCTYNSHRCPGDEGTTGPSGPAPCDFSGCMEVCVQAGGSNCGTDCACD